MSSINNSEPLEIIAASQSLYLAPLGSPFPAVDEDPDPEVWTLLGKYGPLNYKDDGVTVDLKETITLFRALGDTGARKAFRQDEDQVFKLIVTYALLMRGPSPYMEDGAAQYEVPCCMQTGSPSVVYQRKDPAGLAVEFTTLVDPTAETPDERFGRLVAQTDAAETT
jgi:hypothetical protein